MNLMTQISVPVTVEERSALAAMAEKELRHPRDQARYLLRLALLGAANDPPDAGSTNDKSAFTSQGGGALVTTNTIQPCP